MVEMYSDYNVHYINKCWVEVSSIIPLQPSLASNVQKGGRKTFNKQVYIFSGWTYICIFLKIIIIIVLEDTFLLGHSIIMH